MVSSRGGTRAVQGERDEAVRSGRGREGKAEDFAERSNRESRPRPRPRTVAPHSLTGQTKQSAMLAPVRSSLLRSARQQVRQASTESTAQAAQQKATQAAQSAQQKASELLGSASQAAGNALGGTSIFLVDDEESEVGGRGRWEGGARRADFPSVTL